MADGGHLETSKNCDYPKTVWKILLKFCAITHISFPDLTSCSKNKFIKIDFDEICMVMQISRSNPIGYQKFENL